MGRLRQSTHRLRKATECHRPGSGPRWLAVWLPRCIYALARGATGAGDDVAAAGLLAGDDGSFTLPCIVAGMMSLLAILAALNSARRMVSPLSRLSTATREVAAGEVVPEKGLRPAR